MFSEEKLKKDITLGSILLEKLDQRNILSFLYSACGYLWNLSILISALKQFKTSRMGSKKDKNTKNF